MKIFISHRMPTDTPAVAEFSEKIALYAGSSIVVQHAGKFEKGGQFRRNIDQSIDEADLFILFLTTDDHDWSYCIFEAGLFYKTIAANPRRKLVVLHPPSVRRPSALSSFTSVEATIDGIRELLKDIYIESPWSIKPDLSARDIDALASVLASTFKKPDITNYDLIPSFVIEVPTAIADEFEYDVSNGKINDFSIAYGSQGWQMLFGEKPESGAWPWQELRDGWQNRHLYEYEIATMIADALRRRMPQGCYVQMPDGDDIYRLSLRRFESAESPRYRFFFTAAPLDLEAYWLPSGSEKDIIYQLVSLTWSVRRRLVEKYYEEVRVLLSKSSVTNDALRDKFREVAHELVRIEIQSAIRGIDGPQQVKDALPSVDVNRDDALWEKRKTLIRNAAASDDKDDFYDAAEALFGIAQTNAIYYRVAAAVYAERAKGLTEPMPVPPRTSASAI